LGGVLHHIGYPSSTTEWSYTDILVSPKARSQTTSLNTAVMASRNYLMPNAAQCDSLTDEQCRMIQHILDPDGIRAYQDWEFQHQTHLIRLYMKGMSFPDIAKAMERKIDCS
tara:strand:+ start:368 stop:703 length:336 start_codon:yes stop_codon:yes gene_type:complete